MITAGSHRLPASMVIGPSSIPWTSRTVASEIASRYTGNAQIRSRKREMKPSSQPPYSPATIPSSVAMVSVISAARIPIDSDARPP